MYLKEIVDVLHMCMYRTLGAVGEEVIEQPDSLHLGSLKNRRQSSRNPEKVIGNYYEEQGPIELTEVCMMRRVSLD